MRDVVIRAEGLSKKYLIGHQAMNRARYTALRDVMARAAKGLAHSALDMMRGRQLIAGDDIEEFWALRDVSFEIKRGEVVGVIGRNGAGKSTLLKILSRITEPSAGRVEIKGRVASLLEVGTGFHPELTGRENIFLNGAILGMTRAEIRRKFDEIVTFAEVQKFLDTPVKRYSSGMYVRLAFAVAAHLEPEILIVDEVLAVGDGEFQKKCLGKMGEVARHGRTVLVVSHNMGSLASFCETGLLLEGGDVRARSDIRSVLEAYRTANLSTRQTPQLLKFVGPLKPVTIDRISLNRQPLNGGLVISSDDEIEMELTGSVSCSLSGFRFVLALFREGARIVTFHDGPTDLPAGLFRVSVSLPSQFLRPGEYFIAAGGKRVAGNEWFWGTDLGKFEVMPRWDTRYDQEDIGMFNLPGRLVRQILLS
jgi:ABC-type polysaccharide/polyol phosphate transport system ATPase subunit